jgi:ribonuclease-3
MSETGYQTELPALEATLGYRFTARDLLLTALTHPSYRHEHGEDEDFQRLEYLGDAVLGLLTAEYLYQQRRQVGEGTLTVLRSRVTNASALAKLARRLDLPQFLRLGGGLRREQATASDNLLADALEAVVGAIWLDGGYAAARAFFGRHLQRRLQRLSGNPWSGDPKGELQALAQATFQVLPHYAHAPPVGPQHAPRGEVTASLRGLSACGRGGSKQQAEVAAARALLAKVRVRFNTVESHRS